MRKLSKLWVISLPILFQYSCASVPKSYVISEASKKSVLRTPHYGILNQDDIDYYAWKSDFGEEFGIESDAAFFWQCFHKDSITKLSCRNFGPDPFDKVSYSEFSLVIQVADVVHDIGGRRAFEYTSCMEMIKSWKSALKTEDYFCLGATFPGVESAEGGTKTISWTYDKFKTKKGCTSYFEDCDVTTHSVPQCGYPYKEYNGCSYEK